MTAGYVHIRGKLLRGSWKAPTEFASKAALEEPSPEKSTNGDSAHAGAHNWAKIPSVDFTFSLSKHLANRNNTGLPDVEDGGFRSGEAFCLAIQSRVAPPSNERYWSRTSLSLWRAWCYRLQHQEQKNISILAGSSPVMAVL